MRAWRARAVVLSVVAMAIAVAIAVSPAPPAGADAPIQIASRLTLGSTVVVPAPCRLGATDRLTYELDPLFQSPTYFIQFLDGPAASDGTIRLRIPSEAAPGRYVLRGTCSIVRPDGEVTSPLDQYATIDPVEVELVVGAAAATPGGPPYTG